MSTIPTIVDNSASPILVIIESVKPPVKTFKAPLLGDVSEELSFSWVSFADGGLDAATKFAAAVKAGAVAIGEKLSSITDKVTELAEKLPAALAMNPSLTVMTGGFPEHLTLTVNVRLWVYKDPYKDVYEPLITLKEMVTPDIGSAGAFQPCYVKATIGNFLRLTEAVVTGVSTTHSKVIVEGSPAWVDVAIQISTSKVVTKKDIKKFHVRVRTGAR